MGSPAGVAGHDCGSCDPRSGRPLVMSLRMEQPDTLPLLSTDDLAGQRMAMRLWLRVHRQRAPAMSDLRCPAADGPLSILWIELADSMIAQRTVGPSHPIPSQIPPKLIPAGIGSIDAQRPRSRGGLF